MESSVLQSKSFLPSWDDIENVKKKEEKKGERRIVFRNCQLNVESTILILPVLFFQLSERWTTGLNIKHDIMKFSFLLLTQSLMM